jgi:hypothetical protein
LKVISEQRPRKATTHQHSPPHRLTMSTQSGISVPDTNRPTFDPGLDVATLVFSHVQCVKTRVNLAVVSKLWRDASKPAAAYPLRFDLDAFPGMGERTQLTRVLDMMDNDEALSLPYERVVGFLDGVLGDVCDYAASLGSVRLLKWARVNNLAWSRQTCNYAAENGHLPALKYLHENGCPWGLDVCSDAAHHGHLPVLKYLHENGCPWDGMTCYYAAHHGHLPALKYLHENGCPWDRNTYWYAADRKHWDCLQYLVDNKCPRWEMCAEEYAKHLR